MTTSPSLFLNLPVSDIAASTAFYAALGWTQNTDFSDESTSAFPIDDHAVVLIHAHEKFAYFAGDRTIGDARTTTTALVAIPAASREAVDSLVAAAVAAGGAPFREAQDHGFMYGHAFTDLDGHIWEVSWMDPTQLPGA